MIAVAPAAFLNLDLELRSSEDLTPLATHLEKCAFLLFNGAVGDVFQLTAEPLIGGDLNQNPQACTEEFLQTIGALPDGLMALFRGCSERVFDYGFESGMQPPPCMVNLPATQLSNMAQFGIALRVTVYPYDAESPTDEGETIDV
jgi:hypothetical protein